MLVGHHSPSFTRTTFLLSAPGKLLTSLVLSQITAGKEHAKPCKRDMPRLITCFTWAEFAFTMNVVVCLFHLSFAVNPEIAGYDPV